MFVGLRHEVCGGDEGGGDGHQHGLFPDLGLPITTAPKLHLCPVVFFRPGPSHGSCTDVTR